MLENRITICVRGLALRAMALGAGVDSAWKQKKLEARTILENRTDYPASSARFVRRILFNHNI